MEEQCPKCGAFVSEEDFNDEAESQHCPQCHCELPCELAERLRAEFERKTVVCWRCGCRTWAKDVNFDLLGYACPSCGGQYPAELQERLDDLSAKRDGEWEEEEARCCVQEQGLPRLKIKSHYYHLQHNSEDEKPLDFTKLEDAYHFLTSLFRHQAKSWHFMGYDASREPIPLALFREMVNNGGQVKLEILGKDDVHCDICLTRRALFSVDSDEDVSRKSPAPSIGKPCNYIPSWSELFSSAVWREQANQTVSCLPLMLGRSEDEGKEIVMNLTELPHLLIAGATGRRKSLVTRQLIHSLMVCHSPESLRLILFDPKYLEFADYQEVSHLLAPVLNDPAQLTAALSWLTGEMSRRYRLLAEAQVKNVRMYNAQGKRAPLPYIVVVMDEIGDAMMRDGELNFTRQLYPLLAKSRATGIHFILGTERVDRKVLTGAILANFPWRIVLKVADKHNSKLLLEHAGAETLQGKGDMLFKDNGQLRRIQAGYASHEEFLKAIAGFKDYGPQGFDHDLQKALGEAAEEP